MPQNDPIAVSGFGCVSALGHNVQTFRSALLEGRSGVGPVDFPILPDGRVSVAAQVRCFDLENEIDRKTQALTDRFTHFALVAAREAVERSGIELAKLAGARTAVVMGSGIGGQRTLDANYEAVLRNAGVGTDPFAIPKVMANAAASCIAVRYGIHGPCLNISTACSSATQAIGLGLQMMRSGIIDMAVVGGSEAVVTPYNMRSWEGLKVLSPDACRPFSTGRNGMALGEGAAIFVLERHADVVARGVKPACNLLGYGTFCDAKDMLRPDPEGAAAAMLYAIKDSGLPANAIDYINAHGTGTISNDAAETKAVRSAFAAHADTLAMSSTKSMHGHAIGAAGAVELAATIISLEEQIAPPTINWLAQDPACDIDCVANSARRMKIDAAMSNSLAFGGINASLIVARPGVR